MAAGRRAWLPRGHRLLPWLGADSNTMWYRLRRSEIAASGRETESGGRAEVEECELARVKVSSFHGPISKSLPW